MAAGIDGICLMRRRTGNRIETALRDLEKLREEATEVGRRKIRRLFFLRGQSRQCRRDNN
jgi:hypothetical protein